MRSSRRSSRPQLGLDLLDGKVDVRRAAGAPCTRTGVLRFCVLPSDTSDSKLGAMRLPLTGSAAASSAAFGAGDPPANVAVIDSSLAMTGSKIMASMMSASIGKWGHIA